jgi:two-component system, chemotaxis family, chemotaxis protein CheY
MIEILKKMFESNPEKSTIVIKDKCSDCGCETIIEITPTSEGFGLEGGILFKCSPDEYLAKCSVCHDENPKTNDNQKREKNFIKILIVEDEPTSRKTLNSFLLTLGEVDIAVNGNKAITAVEKAIENNKPYELIFLDIIMPELDGITTLKKIRRLETQHEVNEHAKSKVIMTSANTDKDVILKAAHAGCTSYMIKPIDKTRLYNEIRKHGFDTQE